MLFNSIEYILFIPVTIGFYYLLPHRFRWLFLLIASYYFYMCWKPEYAALILVSTAVDYLAGIKIAQSTRAKVKKRWLILSLTVNLGMLFGFKYLNFFSGSINQLFQQANLLYEIPAFQILLPVGISFYTFQTIGYTIDVYKGKTPPEKHFGRLALYVSFFPQLVAGPIERSYRLLPQLREKKTLNYEQITSGLRLILWGFFKKVVIADRLKIFVDSVYTQPESAQGLTVVLATFLLFVQVYVDLAAYTDIARGTARLMGFELVRNFNRPFAARSISGFWNRWHISLTSWFQDYFFKELSYKKNGNVLRNRYYFNIVLTFTLIGLWHGANWTFIAFGLIHGIYIVIGSRTKKFRQKLLSQLKITSIGWLEKTLAIGSTLFLAIVSSYFFGARTIHDAFTLIKQSLKWGRTSLDIRHIITNNDTLLGLLLVAFLFTIEYLMEKKSIQNRLMEMTVAGRWALYLAFIFVVLAFGIFNRDAFIYYQF